MDDTKMSRLHQKRILTDLVDEAVAICRNQGIETVEVSYFTEECGFETGVVSFDGTMADGLRLLGVVLGQAIPVSGLRRAWRVVAGEPYGPRMELVVGPLDNEPPL
jgi:hypothetical protein